MGGVVDSIGDAFGGAADFVGDVAGGIGDFAGDIVEDYGKEIATAIAIYYLGPAALAEEGALAAAGAETFGSSTAAEILANEAASAAFNSGIGTIGSSFLPGNVPGGGYQGGFIKTGIEGLDQALNIAKSGYDLYNTANSLNRPSPQQYPYTQQIPALTYQQTSSGTQVDPNAFGQGLQYSFMAGLPELGDITNIITKSVSGLGNILMNAFGSDNLSEVIKKYGPAVLSVIGGKLSYDDQKRINDIVMGVYNKYNVGTELKGLQYRTGQGLASLPVARGGRPLGSQTVGVAPQRTAADVVVRPKAQMGGIMQIQPLSPMQPAMQSAMYNPLENNNFSGRPMMADGGSSEDEMDLRNEFNYNRRRDEMEDLLDEYQRFKMRKDYQKRYPKDEARNGGRMGYADGAGPIPLGLVDYTGTPWEGAFKKTQPVERKMGLFTNPDGSYPGENMSNPIQAIPRPGQYSTQIQQISQALPRPGMPMDQIQSQQAPQKTQGISRTLVTNAMKDPKFLQILNSVKNRKASGAVTRPSRQGYRYGSAPVRTNQAGITELDYRQKGGFVPPIGVKEKADDIPAMLSNNEFVFTANAVRNAGGGSVKQGAKKMYNLMRQLEGRS
jgi:hypothetical protein